MDRVPVVRTAADPHRFSDESKRYEYNSVMTKIGRDAGQGLLMELSHCEIVDAATLRSLSNSAEKSSGVVVGRPCAEHPQPAADHLRDSCCVGQTTGFSRAASFPLQFARWRHYSHRQKNRCATNSLIAECPRAGEAFLPLPDPNADRPQQRKSSHRRCP